MGSLAISRMDFDVAGHSLLGLELGRTMNQDRERETAKLVRDRARSREVQAGQPGGILSWFGRWRAGTSTSEVPTATDGPHADVMIASQGSLQASGARSSE
jgi:hypothetical protein